MSGEINQELLDKLMTRLDDVTDIKVQLGVLVTQMTMQAKCLDDLSVAVKGNGKPGLIDRVRTLEVSLKPVMHFKPSMIDSRYGTESLPE